MLVKTEKGRLELRPGQRSLGQRERALLLVADGQHTEAQLAGLFGGDGRRLLDLLLTQGYLERKAAARHRTEAPDPSPSPPPADRAPSPPVHGEALATTHSLASARMFLFDMSERLFAPRDKDMALRYREALRLARDPQAMLSVGHQMMADVERLAGPERADSISERLARMLPPEVLDQPA